MDTLKYCHDAVSYTHLDVYKRQVTAFLQEIDELEILLQPAGLRFAKQGEMKRHVTGLVPGRQHGGIFLLKTEKAGSASPNPKTGTPSCLGPKDRK